MKRILSISLLALLLTAGHAAAQTGAVVYSLPRTVLTLKVEAQREAFTAGPYAAYAEKYLGVAARTQDGTTCTLVSITLIPSVEADPASRFAISIPDRASANFLQMCSQGFVVMSDNYTGKQADWRFASPAGSERFEGVDPLGNLGLQSTTLFKTVRTADGFEKVPVAQNQVVEKSADRKAADAAAVIYDLREKRRQIATGDTDATFSGEALQAAIDEIARQEASYLTLFYGVSDITIETRTFDVLPDASNGSQHYTAFRISDKGLLPASEKEGRAVSLDIVTEKLAAPEVSGEIRAREAMVRYRIPAIARCRVSDKGTLLLESRVPVYQLGEESSFPINVLITK
ncbi:MAG: DUF4831 family protein [Bacteroidales bacterium]|nr:DUF4831 family protein [Bacteroidales bacterium]